jgi:hypothetical protein
MFGPPGNGKTTFASRLARLFEQTVYIPYAIEVAGQIIKVFDPGLHRPIVAADDRDRSINQALGAEAGDTRWVACHRPFALAGGELTLEMLDLRYDTQAKLYDAPLHVKAVNGVFLIDDFGRQRIDPTVLLNRWIVPMENRLDYLTLNTGMNFSLPFDELLIFSTNIDPQIIMDVAHLRRIAYKIKFSAPDKDEYRRVFDAEATSHGLKLTDDVFAFIVETLTVRHDFGLAYFQPKFICDQARRICESFATEPRLTRELTMEALANLYLQIEQEGHGQQPGR